MQCGVLRLNSERWLQRHGAQCEMLPFCRGPIPSLSLECALTPDQLRTHLSYMAIHMLEDGERLVSCVNCSCCEVRLDESPFFWCNSCEVLVHCVGCKAKIPNVLEEADIEDTDGGGFRACAIRSCVSSQMQRPQRREDSL